jgi:formiminotetrahydrofolate cyclodeaminase
MKFVKFFKNGAADYDPRQKTFAEFTCENCNHVLDIDVTGFSKSFNISKPRACPNCKCINASDYVSNLQKEIEKLTEQKNEIQIRIDNMIKEIETKKETSSQI